MALLKLAKNQGFSTCSHQENVTNSLKFFFLVLWSVPQTNSSTEEAITSQSSTLPVAFRSSFLPISPKTGFFHAKCVSKRTPTAFLVIVLLCSITLKVLGFFYSFLQLLWLILRALALVPRKVLKNAKNHVFATFALKIALFSLKTGAKAHT